MATPPPTNHHLPAHHGTTAHGQSLRGYPKLAHLMSNNRETAIFRRFGTLAALNILRLQAELQDMEEELSKIISEDASSTNNVRKVCGFASDFRHMRDLLDTEDDEEYSLQYEHIVAIGGKLEEYSRAVTAALQMQDIRAPSSRETSFLRNWLNRPDGGESFLHDRERLVWTPENTGDLMSLLPRQMESDPFTSLLKGFLLELYHRVWGHKKPNDSGYRTYSEEKIARTSTILVSMLSSALPATTVLVLFFVERLIVRLGLIIVFTATFSLALALFSSADKATIFTATATFAAVEVVFVGSTNSTG